MDWHSILNRYMEKCLHWLCTSVSDEEPYLGKRSLGSRFTFWYSDGQKIKGWNFDGLRSTRWWPVTDKVAQMPVLTIGNLRTNGVNCFTMETISTKHYFVCCPYLNILICVVICLQVPCVCTQPAFKQNYLASEVTVKKLLLRTVVTPLCTEVFCFKIHVVKFLIVLLLAGFQLLPSTALPCIWIDMYWCALDCPNSCLG